MTRENVDLGIKVVTLAVALFGVGKYFLDQAAAGRAERKSRALDFVAAYAGDDLVATRVALYDFWRNHSEFVGFAQADGVSERAYGMFVRAALAEPEQSQPLQEALFRLANFYEQVGYCRASELCDAAILDRYFCGRIRAEWVAYAPFFARMGAATGYAEFGQAIGEYAAQCSAS